MVFQAYALFPNLTVAQNVGFGLKVAGMPRADADKRVAEMLDIIKLPEFGDRYPYQLSGGQQQRVALARALAPKPKLLLLDEPLSALDAKVRVSLREEIRSIQKKLGITTIFVTHDQEEALSISDRIVVMYGGKAEQVGTPFEIYNRPATKFVANFVGTLNVLEGTVTDAAIGQGARQYRKRSRSRASSTAPRPATRCRWRCAPRRSRSAAIPAATPASPARSPTCISSARSSGFASASAAARSRSTRSTTRPRRRPPSATRPRSASRRATCWCCTNPDRGPLFVSRLANVAAEAGLTQ